MKADDTKRLKELEREHQRLKRIVADQALDIDVLKEVKFGKFLSSTRRLRPVIPSDFELVLRALLRELAKTCPRCGYRRLHALLNREDFGVNHKLVQRLYRDAGLRVSVKKRERARIGQSTIPSDRLSASRPNHVWAFDFQFDQTSNCRVVKYLNITDEFSKQALAIEVEPSMSGDDIVTILEAPINIHGAPEFVRMDNGTEMTSNTLADWCRFSTAKINFKDRGSPWHNAYVDSFNGKHHNELLGIELFTTLLEAKIMAEDYRQDYNKNRPHSSLEYMTPDEFTENWHHNNQGLTTVPAH